jgi:hypothetical protein
VSYGHRHRPLIVDQTVYPPYSTCTVRVPEYEYGQRAVYKVFMAAPILTDSRSASHPLQYRAIPVSDWFVPLPATRGLRVFTNLILRVCCATPRFCDSATLRLGDSATGRLCDWATLQLGDVAS